MAQNTSALTIRGLHVRRGSLEVLHGVDLTVEPGKPVALLGRNGAGKSTLCEALLGLMQITAGYIDFGGVELAGLPPQHIAAQGITIVPQGRRVFRSLTVDEHLRLMDGLKPGPWSRERVYRAFPRLAERKRNFGNQLSGGEQQMLAIARALMTNPRLIVLDEPSEGLAPAIVDDLLKTLSQLDSDGVSILLVEQNMRVGLRAAERIAVMSAGVITLTTDADTLKGDVALQQRALGLATA
ncbi:ABC transporter ATP-binding protein [Variovorax sp. S2]|uniref:ABC transporter ATP-binding protein n=1 Tax=Variovorax sp. S12S4 TaxID=3029170 RepID=UPI00215CDB1D|nr:ABC transporter ATP-binding protein [Variovorax sp. S12S4]MCR8961352.1 ABC transporter ATP-binding protein [Variovorax sp. S12S4]